MAFFQGSLQDLVASLGELHAVGVDLYLHQQAVDTTTPAGKALFQMMGVFAEFEREMIRERINAGLARTRAKGTKLGRRPVAPSVEARIRALRADGMGMLKIGRELGVGTSVVQRVVASELRKRRQVTNLWPHGNGNTGSRPFPLTWPVPDETLCPSTTTQTAVGFRPEKAGAY